MLCRRIGLALVLALALVGCKKKGGDKAKDDGKKGMQPAAVMQVEAMRPAAMVPAMRPAAAAKPTLAVKMDKGAGMVVIPKGRNPLAGVDISKGFGEGWFQKGAPPTSTPPPAMPATPATTPPAMVPVMAPVMAPVTAPVVTPAMAPPAMTPAAPAKKVKPQPLPYARYVHPDQSFAFRYPQGWTPTAQVGKVKNIPTIVIQVFKQSGNVSPGYLGAIAFILPKDGPNSQGSCKEMIALAKKQTPGLKVGPLKPVQRTGLFMTQAVATINNSPHVSLAICGTAHKRIMFMTFFTLGQAFANYAYGYQLGQALYTFTSDLLKK